MSVAVERGPILRAAIGIGLYAGAFGMAFGAVAVGSGLSVAQAMVLSLVMFSGASQFAFAGVVAAGGNPFAAIPAALLLGVRNAFYGVPMSAILHPARPAPAGDRALRDRRDHRDGRRPADPAGPAVRLLGDRADPLRLLAAGQPGRCLLGRAIDPADFGLEAAAPAVFLALLWPALKRTQAGWSRWPAPSVALALVPFAPPGVPVWPPRPWPWWPGCAPDTRPGDAERAMTALWAAVMVAAVGSYLLKLAGVSLPESVLNHPTVQRVAGFLPMAMLSALVAVELFDGGGRYAVDWRTLAGVAAGVVALLLRRGLLVVFVVAIAVTALLRLVT